MYATKRFLGGCVAHVEPCEEGPRMHDHGPTTYMTQNASQSSLSLYATCNPKTQCSQCCIGTLWLSIWSFIKFQSFDFMESWLILLKLVGVMCGSSLGMDTPRSQWKAWREVANSTRNNLWNNSKNTLELSANPCKHLLGWENQGNHPSVIKKPTRQQHLKTNADPKSFQDMGDL